MCVAQACVSTLHVFFDSDWWIKFLRLAIGISKPMCGAVLSVAPMLRWELASYLEKLALILCHGLL